jgi:hypothetical protein
MSREGKHHSSSAQGFGGFEGAFTGSMRRLRYSQYSQLNVSNSK